MIECIHHDVVVTSDDGAVVHWICPCGIEGEGECQ